MEYSNSLTLNGGWQGQDSKQQEAPSTFDRGDSLGLTLLEQSRFRSPLNRKSNCKGGEIEYTVVVDVGWARAHGDDGVLGLILQKADGGTLKIIQIKEGGLFAKSSQGHKAMLGDRILRVNGIEGDPSKMLKECKKEIGLTFKLRREVVKVVTPQDAEFTFDHSAQACKQTPEVINPGSEYTFDQNLQARNEMLSHSPNKVNAQEWPAADVLNRYAFAQLTKRIFQALDHDGADCVIKPKMSNIFIAHGLNRIDANIGADAMADEMRHVMRESREQLAEYMGRSDLKLWYDNCAWPSLVESSKSQLQQLEPGVRPKIMVPVLLAMLVDALWLNPPPDDTANRDCMARDPGPRAEANAERCLRATFFGPQENSGTKTLRHTFFGPASNARDPNKTLSTLSDGSLRPPGNARDPMKTLSTLSDGSPRPTGNARDPTKTLSTLSDGSPRPTSEQRDPSKTLLSTLSDGSPRRDSGQPFCTNHHQDVNSGSRSKDMHGTLDNIMQVNGDTMLFPPESLRDVFDKEIFFSPPDRPSSWQESGVDTGAAQASALELRDVGNSFFQGDTVLIQTPKADSVLRQSSKGETQHTTPKSRKLREVRFDLDGAQRESDKVDTSESICRNSEESGKASDQTLSLGSPFANCTNVVMVTDDSPAQGKNMQTGEAKFGYFRHKQHSSTASIKQLATGSSTAALRPMRCPCIEGKLAEALKSLGACEVEALCAEGLTFGLLEKYSRYRVCQRLLQDLELYGSGYLEALSDDLLNMLGTDRTSAPCYFDKLAASLYNAVDMFQDELAPFLESSELDNWFKNEGWPEWVHHCKRMCRNVDPSFHNENLVLLTDIMYKSLQDRPPYEKGVLAGSPGSCELPSGGQTITNNLEEDSLTFSETSTLQRSSEWQVPCGGRNLRLMQQRNDEGLAMQGTVCDMFDEPLLTQSFERRAPRGR